MIGYSSLIFSYNGDFKFARLPIIRLILPLNVFISPLCARFRKGWTRSQRGKVLVGKRVWTKAIALCIRESNKSGKKCFIWSGISMPLYTIVLEDMLVITKSSSSWSEERIALRVTYNLFSNKLWSNLPFCWCLTNNCRITGIDDLACLPTYSMLRGTLRHPRSSKSFSTIWLSITSPHRFLAYGFCGRKIEATAYSPASGKLIPELLHSSRKKAPE